MNPVKTENPVHIEPTDPVHKETSDQGEDIISRFNKFRQKNPKIVMGVGIFILVLIIIAVFATHHSKDAPVKDNTGNTGVSTTSKCPANPSNGSWTKEAKPTRNTFTNKDFRCNNDYYQIKTVKEYTCKDNEITPKPCIPTNSKPNKDKSHCPANPSNGSWKNGTKPTRNTFTNSDFTCNNPKYTQNIKNSYNCDVNGKITPTPCIPTNSNLKKDKYQCPTNPPNVKWKNGTKPTRNTFTNSDFTCNNDYKKIKTVNKYTCKDKGITPTPCYTYNDYRDIMYAQANKLAQEEDKYQCPANPSNGRWKNGEKPTGNTFTNKDFTCNNDYKKIKTVNEYKCKDKEITPTPCYTFKDYSNIMYAQANKLAQEQDKCKLLSFYKLSGIKLDAKNSEMTGNHKGMYKPNNLHEYWQSEWKDLFKRNDENNNIIGDTLCKKGYEPTDKLLNYTCDKYKWSPSTPSPGVRMCKKIYRPM